MRSVPQGDCRTLSISRSQQHDELFSRLIAENVELCVQRGRSISVLRSHGYAAARTIGDTGLVRLAPGPHLRRMGEQSLPIQPRQS